MIPNSPNPGPAPVRGKLVALVGTLAAAGLLSLTSGFEGTVLKTYRDPIGVLTYCTGATENAVWGKTYTPAQCQDRLAYDLAEHAEGVVACIHVPLTTGQKIAFVDTAYNIGVPAFCGSSMARRANASDMAGACDALLLWNKASGKVWPGLVRRRALVRQYCTGELTWKQ